MRAGPGGIHLNCYCTADCGDPAEAVRWASLAVELTPDNVNDHQVLGLALYRAGRFAEAAAELEANIPRNPGSAGLDRLFLAMARQRMGPTAAAHGALAGAVRWRTALRAINPEQGASSQRFLHEARSVLAGTLPDLPADVFEW